MKIITSVVLIAMLFHCTQAMVWGCRKGNCTTRPWPDNVSNQLQTQLEKLKVIEQRGQNMLGRIIHAQHEYLQPKLFNLTYRYIMNVSTSWKQGCEGFVNATAEIDDLFINCVNQIFPAVWKYQADVEKSIKKCEYLRANISSMTYDCHFDGDEQISCGITLKDVTPSLDELNESVAALENSILSDPSRSREFLNSIQCITDEVFTYPHEFLAPYSDIMDLCSAEILNRARQSPVKLHPGYAYVLGLLM